MCYAQGTDPSGGHWTIRAVRSPLSIYVTWSVPFPHGYFCLEHYPNTTQGRAQALERAAHYNDTRIKPWEHDGFVMSVRGVGHV